MWSTELCVLLLATTLVKAQIQQQYNVYNHQVYFEDNRPTNVKYTDSRIPQPALYNRENNVNGNNYSEANKRKFQLFGQARPVVPLMDNESPSYHPEGIDYLASRVDETPLQLNNLTLAKATHGIANLGVLFLKNIGTMTSQSVVLSPFSIALSLGLLQQSSHGETLDQISSALQMTPEVASAGFRIFLNRSKGSNNILDIATSIFVDETFSLNRTFRRTATENFNSDVISISFRNAVAAANVINNWVEDKTNHKIQKILSSDSLRDSATVLANAVYFKGKWQYKFNPDVTVEKEFTLQGGQKKNVPFMRLRGGFKISYDRGLSAQVLILPFQKEEFNFMMILPEPNTRLDDVIAKLQVNALLSYNQIPMKEAHIEIPKFTIRTDMDLKAVLQKMGFTKLFSPQSELFGLGTDSKFKPAYISTAVHSSVLSIDESGGTAAAATAFAGVPLSFDDNAVYFKANRPFIAIIWHGELNIPLFVGKIEDPTF